MAKNDGPHLAAILSVDLAEESSEALVRVRDAFRTAVEQHGGSAAPETATGLRAEFLGPADAVASALAMLDAVDDGNVEAEHEAEVRAGIALGEVTATKTALTGPGVDLADGLRDLAVPGGLRIAAAVYEQARGRTKNGFESLGEHSIAGEEIGVYGYDPDMEEAAEPQRVGYRGHRSAHTSHSHSFRSHSHRRSRRQAASATPEDRAKFAVRRMKRLYRGVYVGAATIAFLFLINVLGSNIDWWFAWPAFFIVAGLGLVSFRTLGASGVREAAEQVRGWFGQRTSWVDRKEAKIRADMAARGEPDDGRVALRMGAINAFRRRARAFTGVAAVLFAINLLTSAGDWWFLWPTLVMAYVLALSALNVFGLDSILGENWEDKKRRELVAQFEREATQS